MKQTPIDKAIITAFPHPIPTKKTEALSNRAFLQLRRTVSPQETLYEVYTTIHGTGVFKWFTISEVTYEWYLANFPEITVTMIINDEETKK